MSDSKSGGDSSCVTRRGCALLFAGALLWSCSDDPAPTPAPHGPELESVVYEGTATDEALEHLLDARAIDEPTRYVVFDAPVADATLPSDAPLTFTLREAARASQERTKLVKPRLDWSGVVRRAARLLSPIGVAHAHGAPFNGTGYLLSFADAGGKTHYTVFTSLPTTTLGLDVLADLRGATQPLTVKVVTADFEENRIPSGGGPYAAGILSFRLE